jgi:hypothetical protein
MTGNGQPASLAAALALLQTRLPEIKKSERADVKTDKGSYSYTFADLAQVSRELLPIMGELGLSFTAAPTLADGKFILACTLRHVSGGEVVTATYPLPTSGPPQAIGSAITYGRRYCLCAITGVAPEDDDDGAAAQAQTDPHAGTAQRATAARQRRQPPPTSGTGTVQRTRPPAASLPPLPGETTPDTADTATTAQLQKLVIAFDEIGFDRAERLAVCSTLTGRALASAKELTKTEASQIIERAVWAQTQTDPRTAITSNSHD